MSQKRNSQTRQCNLDSIQNKKRKSADLQKPTYLRTLLEESGLRINLPPAKCVTALETIHIIRNIKRNLQKHPDYPCNISEFYTDFEKHCKDLNIFKHYLYPNIVRSTSESNDCHVNDSVIKVLLSVPILQTKLMDYIFEKAIDLAADSNCGPWIQMILKCFSTLNNLLDTEKMSTNLINLLDVASEKMVRLEIINSIPDIIGDQEHDNIANEMSRIISEDHDLIPAILDCLSYLCLSEEQYERLQKKTLNILMTLSKCNYFPNFVEFLFMLGRLTDSKYLELINGLRNALSWPMSMSKPQDIASSQVLTATAIRKSMVSSKNISNAWYKIIADQNGNDQKPIDFIIMLILYSTSEEKQKQVENMLIKQTKLNIFKEDLFNEAFDKFKPILEVNLRCLINLTNCLLKTKSNLMIQDLAAHIYILMFSELEEYRQTIVAELLQLALNYKQCVMNILIILNNVAMKDISILKPQSIQMLMLLDRMDDMNLMEIKAAMNLLCCLAYTFDNSVIRDDLHMIIRKELSSSSPAIKIQGIISGIHAVKYLTAAKTDNEQIHEGDSSCSIDHLKDGDLKEAAQIIELISRSTKQFPDMIVFFYDELSKMIQSCNDMNKYFVAWLTHTVTNDLQQSFMIDCFEPQKVGNIKLTIQHCLNSDSEIDEDIAINIGGLTVKKKEDVNISILSPLFKLVQTLHLRLHKGSLSSIDALLGCPIVMPIFDIDIIEDMDLSDIHLVLDCLVYCVNWMRELINAFSSQSDSSLETKLFNRISQVQQLEHLIGKVVIISNFSYKVPSHTPTTYFEYSSNKITKSQSTKQKNQKQTSHEDSLLPETTRTQGTQRSNNLQRIKFDLVNYIKFRPLSLSISSLLNHDLCDNDELSDSNPILTIERFNYILKNICSTIEPVLVFKITHKTHLSKDKENYIAYNKNEAEEYARCINGFLPNLILHLKSLTSYFDKHNIQSTTQNESVDTFKTLHFIVSLEYIYNLCSIYLKWIGFQNNNNISLLKTSLRSLASLGDDGHLISLEDLLMTIAKLIQEHEKYCFQLSTAVALMEVLKALQRFSSKCEILKILRDTANHFLSKQWKSPDGAIERGLQYNQSIDGFAKQFLINNEIVELKNISISLVKDIEAFKNCNKTLSSFKSINKSNFPIFFRNLGTALNEVTKRCIHKGLTNSEHLELWKDVTFILKCMTEISKNLDNRNNLSAFFKKSLPLIKLFLTYGIPIIELQFKNETHEVLEIFKTLQQTTRFLQSLCCHSRLKKDSVLMSKVPTMRQLLEVLIYKVKAALTANNCSEAFWMGNLKNKNIHGEVIASQQSVDDESVEDCDDQLPDDDDSDDSDNEMINPDSKSLSDIV